MLWTSNMGGFLNYLILLVCGDIHLNPDPVCYPYGVCGKSIRSSQKALFCDSCDLWLHTRCVQVSDANYAEYCSLVSFNWICTLFVVSCLVQTLVMTPSTLLIIWTLLQTCSSLGTLLQTCYLLATL